MNCPCPKDWVAYFSSTCPRAAEIRSRQNKHARDFLAARARNLAIKRTAK